MKTAMALAAAAILVMGACAPQSEMEGVNPLLTDRTTPFGVPPFDEIREEHLKPAFESAMAAHIEEISAIVENPDATTFANTIEAFDRSGQDVDQVHLLFLNANMANTSPGLQALAKEINPMWTGHQDDLMLNQKLFERVNAIYQERENLDLTIEEGRLLEKFYKKFVRGGANLDDAAKERLRALNGEISTLSTQFGENLVKEMNSVALFIEDEAELVGLPQSIRDSAAALAMAEGHEGQWAFNLQRTSWTPFLQYSERRDLRQKLYTAYTMLCNNNNETDNTRIASRIAALRAERAMLLGYSNHAAYVLEENMAERPENVSKLLDQLWKPTLAKVKVELTDLQNYAREIGDDVTVETWDWWYYAEKLRAARYDFDEAAVKPYLELGSVRNAAFDVAGRLWGLSFEELSELPVYHPDVKAFEVKDNDGSHLGVFYVDYYARESKRGGAWMEFYRRQWKDETGDVRPIVVNVCNFSKPGEGQPALLSLDEASTIFHEFGHALHGLLADGHYIALSGTNVAQDFVELPSQMMENWAFAPEFLPTYARHFETGEPIPAELVEKLQRARQFNQGFKTTEYLAASILDMMWHTLNDANERPAIEFEKSVLDGIGLVPEVVSRYRTTYFGHIFSGEYSAGYYSYVWAEVLDADGFEAFKEAGIFDQELAKSYRENILAAGASEAPMVLYERFRGSAPSTDALVARRGLN